jgi:flagellar protein FliS
MTYARATSTYRHNAVLTASPEKLVRMLYDRAIQSLERSRRGVEQETTRRSAEVGQSLGLAMSVLGELRTSLDLTRGGDIAQKLDALYEFTLDQVSQANLLRDATHVDAALRVLKTLKEGWDVVIPA